MIRLPYPRAISASAGLAFALAALAGQVGSAPPAAAQPAPHISVVRQQVRDLQMQAGAAHEEAAKAEQALQSVQSQLGTIRARQARQLTELSATQSVLSAIARNLYMEGVLDPTLQVLLANDPTALLSQSALLNRLSAHQADQIRKFQTQRLRLTQTQAAITEQEKQASALSKQKFRAEAQVTARLHQAQVALSRLTGQEQRKLARLQSQRRNQQLAQARLAAKRAQGGALGNVSARTRRAVQYALAQVGAPYSYSARPPSSWDCSKLTSAAWARAGVGLTALSYTQWDQTRRIPVSDIRPGDLVFYFGRGAHHVAMYVGNGKMVSASNPSDGVELTDFLGPWYRERFSGVGRILG